MFSLFFQERTEGFLSLRNLLRSFPAIDIKNLLKWFAMIKLSDVVLLSYIQSFYTTPYSFWVFFIGFKVYFAVVIFTKTIQSYCLIPAVFKFLMKNKVGVGSLAKLFVQLNFYTDGFKNARCHPQFWGIPFNLSFRGWKCRTFII